MARLSLACCSSASSRTTTRPSRLSLPKRTDASRSSSATTRLPPRRPRSTYRTRAWRSSSCSSASRHSPPRLRHSLLLQRRSPRPEKVQRRFVDRLCGAAVGPRPPLQAARRAQRAARDAQGEPEPDRLLALLQGHHAPPPDGGGEAAQAGARACARGGARAAAAAALHARPPAAANRGGQRGPPPASHGARRQRRRGGAWLEAAGRGLASRPEGEVRRRES
mmetsp:Transcript_48709/g.162565  ORF Transcript_48709/g.162565 Transcript_48709/m.162565 type:complete len:222 (+) Transcript_48709:399-1064(+)